MSLIEGHIDRFQRTLAEFCSLKKNGAEARRKWEAEEEQLKAEEDKRKAVEEELKTREHKMEAEEKWLKAEKEQLMAEEGQRKAKQEKLKAINNPNLAADGRRRNPYTADRGSDAIKHRAPYSW